MKPNGIARLSAFVLFALFRTGIAASSADYATLGSVDVEQENGPVKKCELFVPLVKLPESVALRIKRMTMGDAVVRSFTVDVIEFKRVSNGIPYDPEKKPIVSARIVANTFDSDKISRRVDMGDGGIGYDLGSDANLVTLLSLVKRGDYYVTFKRSDRSEFTSYAIGEKVPIKFLRELDACMAKM